MKKEDIKSGMLVKLRKGCWCLTVEYKGMFVFTNGKSPVAQLINYSDSLNNGLNSNFDIVAVAMPSKPNLVKLNDGGLDVIWERRE